MIRYEFIDRNVSEADIHPKDVFENERELAFEFIKEKKLSGDQKSFLFKRYNIPYYFDVRKNLLASVKISEELHYEYFFNSPLSRLRASEDYQQKVKSLRSHTWKSYIEWIEGRCFRYLEDTSEVETLDIGSRSVGWVEELKESKLLKRLSLLEPLPPIASVALDDKQYDVVIAFNIIQRELNPLNLLKKIENKLSGDGIAVLSFRSGTGFDVLALKEKGKSIFPLDHLFLPSIEGISSLLEEANLEVLEITTPGQLDAEIVKSAVEQGMSSDPLLNHLFETVPSEEIQSFIQKNNLSSHVRVVAKRRK